MRRLFYRFSDRSVYYRYFTVIKVMPHSRMQAYVNIDYHRIMSVVGTIGDPDQERIIAEGRFVRDPQLPEAEIAIVVDENYTGSGIATYLYTMLIRLARERGMKTLTGEVLSTNAGIKRVLEKGGLPVTATLHHGIESLRISLESNNSGRTEPILLSHVF
jgi:RimJ/RimL family protein N-acetyltransferase